MQEQILLMLLERVQQTNKAAQMQLPVQHSRHSLTIIRTQCLSCSHKIAPCVLEGPTLKTNWRLQVAGIYVVAMRIAQ